MDDEAVGFVNQADDGESSEAGLTFVKRVATYEPDGPVSVDLLELFDGRVLGITEETIMLYPSMEAFENDEGDPTAVRPAIDLTSPTEGATL